MIIVVGFDFGYICLKAYSLLIKKKSHSGLGALIFIFYFVFVLFLSIILVLDLMTIKAQS